MRRNRLKTFLKLLVGFAAGAAVAYYSLHLKEEKLIYTLSDPADFGNLTYQNIEIKNLGWDPAENIVVSFNTTPVISYANVKASAPFLEVPKETGAAGKIDRIRRDETVTLSLSFPSTPLSPQVISIKSDRSIAQHQPSKRGWSFDWISFWIGVVAIFVFAGVLGGASSSFSKAKNAAKTAYKEKFEQSVPH